MKRLIAFLAAFLASVVLCLAALAVGHPFWGWVFGFISGAVVVLANVLTHPLLFGWNE